jgi:acetyl esterase/lipase
MVSIAIEYRLISKESTEPPVVCIQDAQSAMRWVRGHAAGLGIDPARIAAGGGSAGAHLSAFTGLLSGFDDPADDRGISPKPQALILFNPVIDNGPGGFGNAAMKARYLEFSPFHHVSPAAPPTLIMGGDADKLVSVAMLKEFAAKMNASGVRCDLHIYPGGVHGFYRTDEPGRPYYSQTLLEIDKFLASLGWLGGPPAAAIPAPAATRPGT